MTLHNPPRGLTPAMPNASRKPKPVLTALQWAELHDALTLALDALGDGPDDVDGPFLLNCVMHQRGALRLAHALKDQLEGHKPC